MLQQVLQRHLHFEFLLQTYMEVIYMKQLGGLRHAKDVILHYINMYLHNKDNYAHLMPKELPSDAFEHIIIYDTNPESLRQFPMVVISASSGKYQTAGLADVGHELYDNNGNEIGIMYCGIFGEVFYKQEKIK